MSEKTARMAAEETDYKRLGIPRGNPAVSEDALRTTGAKGSYEWWYFDAKLQDGSSLVIVFHTGPIASFSAGFRPHVTFEWTLPDGTGYSGRVDAASEDSSFSAETCDVKIGACTFRGNLHQYEIYYKDASVEAKIQLTGSVLAWRPHTGHIMFGEKNYFAWLPSVPEGSVKADITQNGVTAQYAGTGYHDHNWGNVPMFFLMHHWYWGRAKVGDYQVVSSYITANKKYGYSEIPIFMLAKNGEILADEAEKYLTYTESELFFDACTKKHVAGCIVYDYDDGVQHYRVTYRRREDLERIGMETQVTRCQYVLVWLMGLRGSYHRMGGTVTLERFENGTVAEKIEAPALWEQMYFGKDRVS